MYVDLKFILNLRKNNQFLPLEKYEVLEFATG